MKYMQCVDESYDVVKERFEKNALLKGPRNQETANNMIKNFGMSAWNDGDAEDDWDVDKFDQGIFEGSAEEEKKEARGRIFGELVGS
jgi:hypothetical protein